MDKNPDTSPLASIVIPCYNAERWVAGTIESCFNQTYKNIEVIVIDDGSTDGSLSVLKKYVPRIKLETGPNRGVSAARNRGLALARGKYVKFLDADDLLESGAVEDQIDYMLKTGADVCYGDFRYAKILPSKELKYFPVIKTGPVENVVKALICQWWSASFSYLFKMDFLLEHNCEWDVNLSSYEDFDFFLRVALKGAGFCYAPVLTGIYLRHDEVGGHLSGGGITNFIKAQERLCENLDQLLSEGGAMSAGQKNDLCNYYLWAAKNIFGVDRQLFRKMVSRINQLDPAFRRGKWWYDLPVRLFGYEKTEWVWELRRKIIKFMRRKNYYEKKSFYKSMGMQFETLIKND